jgi:hypothetical protein
MPDDDLNMRDEDTEANDFSGHTLQGDSKKFVKRQLGFLDIFANFKYSFWTFIYGTFTSAKG